LAPAVISLVLILAPAIGGTGAWLAGRRNDLHEGDWGVLAGIGACGTRGAGNSPGWKSWRLRAGCEVTVKVLCYVRSYPDVCNVHALAGNEFFFINLVSCTKG
jgi:hypothetical protein